MLPLHNQLTERLVAEPNHPQEQTEGVLRAGTLDVDDQLTPLTQLLGACVSFCSTSVCFNQENSG